MSNFEMKYTIRLYDPDLVVEIGNLYKAHSKEFRNKNEFMTCLIRLGVDALNATPPTTTAAAAVPPAMALDIIRLEANHQNGRDWFDFICRLR